MHRREFLKSTSAAAFAAGSLPAAAAHTGGVNPGAVKRTLRLVTPWADSVTGPGDHVRRLAARIAAASGGRWTIEITEAASASDAVAFGAADLSIAPENANVARHRGFAWFSGLPAGIGLDAEGHAAWITTGGGQELWDELAADHNFKGLAAGWTGSAPALWSRTPLGSPADLEGKRIAVAGLAREIAAGLGALPVAVPPGEIAEALAAGEIDMAVAPDACIATRSRLSAAVAHGYLSNLDVHGGAITLGMRRSFWDALAASDRILLSALAAEAFAASRAEASAEMALAVSLPAGLLPTLARLPAAINHAIERIAASVIAEGAGADDISRRINHSYMAFRSIAGRREPVAVG